MNVLQKLWRDESGATAIEYALIAAIVGLGIITSLQALPNSLINIFTDVNDGLS